MTKPLEEKIKELAKIKTVTPKIANYLIKIGIDTPQKLEKQNNINYISEKLKKIPGISKNKISKWLENAKRKRILIF